MTKPRKPPRPHVRPLTDEEAQALLKRVEDAAYKFKGPFDELESAVGMFFLGRLFGWRLIVLIHNKRTIRKYEDILGIDIRKEFDPEGPFIDKSVGMDIVNGLKSFWKAVSGEVPVEGRRELT